MEGETNLKALMHFLTYDRCLIKVIVFQCPVGEVIVTGFWALHLGVRKFLVLLEKEFKDGHRGDLSRGRFIINAKQSQSKAKVHPPDGRVGRIKSQHYAGGPKTSSFYWGLQHGGGQFWKTGLIVS
jgi:hypothetical protein